MGRNQKGLEATRQAVVSKGRRCVAIQSDLQTVEGPRAAGAQALAFFGTVDIPVNNAGVFHRQSILVEKGCITCHVHRAFETPKWARPGSNR